MGGHFKEIIMSGYGLTQANDIIRKVMELEGGSRIVEDDAGQGVSKFGITYGPNKDKFTPEQIRNLTEEQAFQHYKERYYDGVGGDSLPENLRWMAMDASVQHGPGTAKRWLEQSGGDPTKFMEQRRQLYANLIARPRQVNGKTIDYNIYKKGWENRIGMRIDTGEVFDPKLQQFLGGTMPTPTPAAPTNQMSVLDEGNTMQVVQPQPQEPVEVITRDIFSGGALFNAYKRDESNFMAETNRLYDELAQPRVRAPRPFEIGEFDANPLMTRQTTVLPSVPNTGAVVAPTEIRPFVPETFGNINANQQDAVLPDMFSVSEVSRQVAGEQQRWREELLTPQTVEEQLLFFRQGVSAAAQDTILPNFARTVDNFFQYEDDGSTVMTYEQKLQRLEQYNLGAEKNGMPVIRNEKEIEELLRDSTTDTDFAFRLQDSIERAQNRAIYEERNGVANFTGSFVGQMADPVDFVAGGGLGKALKGGSLRYRAGAFGAYGVTYSVVDAEIGNKQLGAVDHIASGVLFGTLGSLATMGPRANDVDKVLAGNKVRQAEEELDVLTEGARNEKEAIVLANARVAQELNGGGIIASGNVNMVPNADELKTLEEVTNRTSDVVIRREELKDTQKRLEKKMQFLDKIGQIGRQTTDAAVAVPGKARNAISQVREFLKRNSPEYRDAEVKRDLLIQEGKTNGLYEVDPIPNQAKNTKLYEAPPELLDKSVTKRISYNVNEVGVKQDLRTKSGTRSFSSSNTQGISVNIKFETPFDKAAYIVGRHFREKTAIIGDRSNFIKEMTRDLNPDDLAEIQFRINKEIAQVGETSTVKPGSIKLQKDLMEDTLIRKTMKSLQDQGYDMDSIIAYGQVLDDTVRRTQTSKFMESDITSGSVTETITRDVIRSAIKQHPEALARFYFTKTGRKATIASDGKVYGYDNGKPYNLLENEKWMNIVPKSQIPTLPAGRSFDSLDTDELDLLDGIVGKKIQEAVDELKRVGEERASLSDAENVIRKEVITDKSTENDLRKAALYQDTRNKLTNDFKTRVLPYFDPKMYKLLTNQDGYWNKFMPEVIMTPMSKAYLYGSDALKGVMHALAESPVSPGMRNNNNAAMVKDNIVRKWTGFVEAHTQKSLEKYLDLSGKGSGKLAASSSENLKQFNEDYFTWNEANRVAKANGTQAPKHPYAQELFEEMAETLKRSYTGIANDMKSVNAKGFDNLNEMDYYMPWLVDPAQFQNIMNNTNLKDNYVNAMAEEIATNYELSNGVAENIARVYVDRLVKKAAGLNPIDTSVHVGSQGGAEMVTAAKELLEAGKITDPAMIQRVTDMVNGRVLKGQSGRTKSRISRDLNKPIGEFEGKTITLGDIMIKDPNVLRRSYINSASGEYALIKAGFVNGKEDLDLITKALIDKGEDPRAREALEQIVAEITGTPFRDAKPNNFLEGLGIFTRLARLGGASISQVLETFNMIPVHGIAAVVGKIPEIGRMSRELRDEVLSGNFNENSRFYKIYEAYGNIGLDGYLMNINPSLINDYTGLAQGVQENRLLRKLRQGERLQYIVNGQRWIQAVQERMAFELNVTEFTRNIVKGKITPYMKDAGISEKLMKDIQSEIGKSIQVDGKGNILSFDPELAANPSAVGEFINTTLRSKNQQIQRAYIGETGRWSHSPGWKAAFVFRTYPIVALEKQLRRSFAVEGPAKFVLQTCAVASMYIPIQMLRVAANTIGMDAEEREKYLDENLNMMALAQSSLMYSSRLGLAPDIFNIGYTGVTGESLSGKTLPQGTSLPNTIPTLGMVQSLVNLPNIAKDVSEGELDTLRSITPFGNVPYIRAGFQALETAIKDN